MKTKRLIFLSFFLLILLIGVTNAVSTVYVQTHNSAILVEYPKIFNLKQHENFYLKFHIFNKTDGKVLTNETANCTFNLYSSSGKGLYYVDYLKFNATGANDCPHCFYANISGGNFSETGSYSYLLKCETFNSGGAVSAGFEVTPSGRGAPGAGEGLTFLGSLIAMFMTAGIFFTLSHSIKDHPGAKFAFLALMVVTCIVIVLYSSVVLMETFWGFDKIISSYSTFLWVFLFIIFIIFIFILISLMLKAIDSIRTKRGLKE